jgi:hypothetical protein
MLASVSAARITRIIAAGTAGMSRRMYFTATTLLDQKNVAAPTLR